MAGRRKTWLQKRQSGKGPKVEKTVKAFADIPAGATMLVATPAIVHDYLTQIPPGKQTTLAQMRKDLAASYNAQYTCPVTAGIFLRIAAEAAWEELQAGKRPEEIAPFWRMISANSPTAKKLSFGTEFLLAQRVKENLD